MFYKLWLSKKQNLHADTSIVGLEMLKIMLILQIYNDLAFLVMVLK